MNNEPDGLYGKAAKLFAVLSMPIRWRSISELCQGEQNPGPLLGGLGFTQANMCPHLNSMHRPGILANRRQGAQMFDRIADESVAMACKTVCHQ